MTTESEKLFSNLFKEQTWKSKETAGKLKAEADKLDIKIDKLTEKLGKLNSKEKLTDGQKVTMHKLIDQLKKSQECFAVLTGLSKMWEDGSITKHFVKLLNLRAVDHVLYHALPKPLEGGESVTEVSEYDKKLKYDKQFNLTKKNIQLIRENFDGMIIEWKPVKKEVPAEETEPAKEEEPKVVKKESVKDKIVVTEDKPEPIQAKEDLLAEIRPDNYYPINESISQQIFGITTHIKDFNSVMMTCAMDVTLFELFHEKYPEMFVEGIESNEDVERVMIKKGINIVTDNLFHVFDKQKYDVVVCTPPWSKGVAPMYILHSFAELLKHEGTMIAVIPGSLMTGKTKLAKLFQEWTKYFDVKIIDLDSKMFPESMTKQSGFSLLIIKKSISVENYTKSKAIVEQIKQLPPWKDNKKQES